MNKNTENKTSKLLLHKQEISHADLDTVSGGRFNWRGFARSFSKVSGGLSNVVSISTIVSGAGGGNSGSAGDSGGTGNSNSQ